MKHLTAADIDDETLALILRDLTFYALPGKGKTRYLRTAPEVLKAAALATVDLVLTAAARRAKVRGSHRRDGRPAPVDGCPGTYESTRIR